MLQAWISLEIHYLLLDLGTRNFFISNFFFLFNNIINKILKNSDKTVRLFKWISGSGFEEDKNSPFLGHKYAVTKVEFSPKVSINDW